MSQNLATERCFWEYFHAQLPSAWFALQCVQPGVEFIAMNCVGRIMS